MIDKTEPKYRRIHLFNLPKNGECWVVYYDFFAVKKQHNY